MHRRRRWHGPSRQAGLQDSYPSEKDSRSKAKGRSSLMPPTHQDCFYQSLSSWLLALKTPFLGSHIHLHKINYIMGNMDPCSQSSLRVSWEVVQTWAPYWEWRCLVDITRSVYIMPDTRIETRVTCQWNLLISYLLDLSVVHTKASASLPTLLTLDHLGISTFCVSIALDQKLCWDLWQTNVLLENYFWIKYTHSKWIP